MTTKVCNKKDCVHGGKEQPIDNFGRQSSHRGDRHPTCRDCNNAIRKAKFKQSKEWLKIIIG